MVEALTVVRSLHILFAVLWAGGAVHYQKVTLANLSAEEHAAYVANSRHGPFMGVTSLATIGFGLATYMMVGPSSYGSVQNAILGIGMAAAIVTALVGFGGHLPISVKVKQFMAQNDAAGIDGAMGREKILDKISGIGIAIALLSMITFRWF